MPLVIEHIWAFIAEDEQGEGVCGFLGPDGWMPLIAADQARVESLRRVAKDIKATSGKTIKLVKFSLREEVEVI